MGFFKSKKSAAAVDEEINQLQQSSSNKTLTEPVRLHEVTSYGPPPNFHRDNDLIIKPISSEHNSDSGREVSDYGINPHSFQDEIDEIHQEKYEILIFNVEKQIQLISSKIEWKRTEKENSNQSQYYKKQFEDLLEIVREIDEECVGKVELIDSVEELEKLKMEYVLMQ